MNILIEKLKLKLLLGQVGLTGLKLTNSEYQDLLDMDIIPDKHAYYQYSLIPMRRKIDKNLSTILQDLKQNIEQNQSTISSLANITIVNKTIVDYQAIGKALAHKIYYLDQSILTNNFYEAYGNWAYLSQEN